MATLILKPGRTVGFAAMVPAVTAPLPAPTPVPTLDKPTLAWTQKYPIGSNSKFLIPVGYFTVAGGIGPYAITLSSYDKYRFTASNEFTLRTNESPVGAADDVMTAFVTDGRGLKSDPITVIIRKADGDGAGLNTPNPVMSFAPVWNGRLRTDAAPLYTPGAYGPGHGDTRQDGVSVVDPKGVWASFGAGLYSPNGLPPVGSYPVTITVTNKATGVATSFPETLVVVPPSEIVGAFVQTSVWTDTTPPGTDIGYVAASTPDNNPTFVVNTPSLAVSATRRITTVGNPQPGDFGWAFTVSSGGTAISKAIQVTTPVLKGTALDPATMTLALNPLDNSTPGQKVGQLAVRGQSGGKYAILDQSGFNPAATTGQWGNPARYQVDGTGLVYTPPDCMLSFQDPACGWEDDRITAVWTSADGMTTCQQTFPIPVADTVKVRAVITATDKGTLHAAAVTSNHAHPGVAIRVNVAANPDPDAYTDATRGDDTKGGWVGPVVVNLADGARLGGKADNTGVSSGVTSYGKGHIIASTGDMRLQGKGMISGVHGGGSSDGKEGIRKDGNTYGNLVVSDLTVQDCDQGLESGPCHGYVYASNIAVRRCGGASVGAGLTHGFYIGQVSKFEIIDSYIDAILYGHLLKSRARQTIIRRCTIVDSGAAACCIDLPNGGDVLIEDCTIVKGPFAANPSVINFGAESSDGAWPLNRLTLNRNTIVAGGISYGGNYGPIFVVSHYHVPGVVPSVVQGDGNSIWLPPLGQISMDLTNYTVPGTTGLTNTTILAVPPKIPARPGLLTRPYRHRAITEGAQYPNFNGVPVLTDNPFPTVSAPGLAAILTPTRDIESGADNFLAGFTSSLAQDQVHDAHSNPTPWAPADAFRMDGTSLIYNGGLKPGGYFVQPQFRTTDGTIANHRMLVTVTQ